MRLFMMMRSEHVCKHRKFVLLTYSLTASHCSTEAHLAGVPFPHSFVSHLVLRQSCSARLKSLVGCWCKKLHWFCVLIKVFLVRKKGTKTAVLSRVAKGVAKLRSVVATANPGSATPARMNLKGRGMKQTNHFNLGIESRWCLNHVHDL